MFPSSKVLALILLWNLWVLLHTTTIAVVSRIRVRLEKIELNPFMSSDQNENTLIINLFFGKYFDWKFIFPLGLTIPLKHSSNITLSLQDMATVPTVLATTGTVVAPTVGSNASCHSHSLENATHLAGTGVQVLIYMGQMQPASNSVGWSVDARCDSHTDFHLQQKIEYKSSPIHLSDRYNPAGLESIVFIHIFFCFLPI